MPSISSNKLSSFTLIALFLLLQFTWSVSGQYNDFRCKCICPSPNVVTKKDVNATVKTAQEKPDRSVYIGNVHPHECNCDGVVLPQLTPDVQGKAKEFCPRCECKYESRNTTTIRWVVTLIIGVIVCLVIYMGFLMLLDPLLHKTRRSEYEEQVNDIHDTELEDTVANASGSESRGSRSESMTAITSSGMPITTMGKTNIVNRAEQHHTKWKKQVEEQRKNIYDDHTMLN